MKYKKQFLFLAILIIILVLPVIASAISLNIQDYPEIGGIDLDCVAAGTCDLSVGIIVAFIYNASIWIGGVVAFVTIVYAGFLYIFSGSTPGNRSKAKGMLTNVVWGIGILLLSYIALVLINPDLINSPDLFLREIEEKDADLNIGNVENRISGCDDFDENISICIADNPSSAKVCADCCFDKSDAAGKQVCQTNFLDAFIPECFQKYKDAGLESIAAVSCQSDCVEGLVTAISLGLDPAKTCGIAIAKYELSDPGPGDPGPGDPGPGDPGPGDPDPEKDGINLLEYGTLLLICNQTSNNYEGIIISKNNNYMMCFLQDGDAWCDLCTNDARGQSCLSAVELGSNNPGMRACGYLDNEVLDNI